MEYRGMTFEEQEAARQERLNEKGTEAPCPMCKRPRVKRSDYIRCNPCGVNWLDGYDLGKKPDYSLAAEIRAKNAAGGKKPEESD